MNEVTPFAITTENEQNSLSHSLTYTNQDFWSLKTRMLEIIRQKFSKDFNDFSESSLAMMLIELWAFLADQLSFKIDQIANELFIDTVTETANIMRLAELVGFKPTPPTPARTMFNLNLNQTLTTDLTIDTPLLVSFQAANGMGEKFMELFQADERNNPMYGKPIIIPAGQSFITNVIGVEGKTSYKSFQGTGHAWQQVPISVPNVLWGSVSVSVDDVQWQKVDFFTAWQPMPEFRVEYINQYQAVVIFGDNKTGLVPAKGANINVSYRTGGGDSGNVVTGAINKTITIHVVGLSHMVSCTINNYTKGEGGYNGDTIDDIRFKLPIYMKTQDRAVTGEDYKSICEGFASPTNGVVGKAAVALRNQGCAGNIVDIYLLAQDGPIRLIKANDNLKKDLSVELIKKKMFSDYVCLRDGDIVLTDIFLEVVISKTNKQHESIIREKVFRRLSNLLSTRNFDFGQSLKEADIIKAVADIKEIEHLGVSFVTEKSIEQGQGNVNLISVAFNEIIRPDNIAINFVYR